MYIYGHVSLWLNAFYMYSVFFNIGKSQNPSFVSGRINNKERYNVKKKHYNVTMKKVLSYKTRKNENDVLQIISLLLVLPSVLRAQNTLGCPDLIKTNKCSCYTFEDGKTAFLFIIRL